MVKQLTLGEMQENCYIVYNEDKNAIIIDPGYGFEIIDNFVKQNRLNVQGILLTHGHFDHCASCFKFQKQGIKIYIHELDADKLNSDYNLSKIFGMSFDKLQADETFQEGKLVVGDFEFEVIHTPGHSKGSVCFVFGEYVFTGDTIFENGYGRTDFYDGSFSDIKISIRKLYPYLHGEYILKYGH